jgi:hypothetical protein
MYNSNKLTVKLSHSELDLVSETCFTMTKGFRIHTINNQQYGLQCLSSQYFKAAYSSRVCFQTEDR